MALFLFCLISFLINEVRCCQRNSLAAQKVNFLAKFSLTYRQILNVLGHVTGLNGFYLSRFKTRFLNLPVLYIPCREHKGLACAKAKNKAFYLIQ